LKLNVIILNVIMLGVVAPNLFRDLLTANKNFCDF
jgi:hypothetical protein